MTMLEKFQAMDGSSVVILWDNGTCKAFDIDDDCIATGPYDIVLQKVKAELDRIAESCIG